MKRREFVRGAGLCGALAATGCASATEAPAVHTRRRVRWRLASSFPPALDTLYGSAERLAARLREMSGGDFEIVPYPAGELVPALQVLDAVQQGTVACGHSASYYYTGKNPALAFDAGLPFGLTARQQLAWLYEGGGLEEMRALFADFGVIPFPAGSTGVQMGGWFRRRVDGLSDLRGLKMRIPGLGGEVMSRLGVSVQVLPGGEIFPALERGAIDATEWVGPYDDEKLGLHRIASHYYYPGWWEPGATLSFYVNRERWAGLGEEHRAMFEAAAAEVTTRTTAEYDRRNPAALTRLLKEGVDLRAFPEDVLAAARDASFTLYEEQAAADPGYRRIYDSWKRFRREAYVWFGTAEAAYTRFAFPSPDSIP